MPAQGAAFLPAPVAVARPRLRGVGATQASSFVCAPGARRAALVPPPPARHARRVRRAVPSAALPALPVLASSLAAGIAASAAKFAPIGVSVVLLGSVVVWHEYGHLRAAQLQGIRVKNFSIGFGPTLFSFEGKNGTVYTLRLLPLGGFVSFPENKLVNEETGELTGELDSDPDLLQNRPILDRAIVISAGVVANVVMAWGALFLSSALVGQAVYNVSPGVVISSIVDANGAGAKSNLLPGDVVLAVDGVAVPSTLESATVVAGKIRRSGGHPMDFRLARGGKELNKSVRANYVPSTGESALGVQLIPNAAVTRQRPTSVPMAIRRTNEDFVRLSAQTWNGLKSLFTNFRESSSNLSGPIGTWA
jgi:membrane-associated protease RseP (regulator of RpoE activity)